MQYTDIVANMRAALQQRSHKPRALVAAPYAAEVIAALEKIYSEGYLDVVVLVGDAEKIPDSHPDFTRVHLADPQAIADFTASESREGGGVVIKGNISSSTLLKAVLAGTGAKHIASHVYIIRSRAFPDKTVLVADAGVNIHPDLKAKAEILKNTVEVARRVGIVSPRVALISAVENINPAMQSTLDAAALKVMGERHVFGDARVDGPMAFDAAMLLAAAATKGLAGPVAGCADVLILDDIEAGNSTAKALIGADGDAMGVVVGGGRVVAFPSRGDSEKTRYDSLLLAAFLSAQ
jgi:phosphotransacetylase